MAGLYLVARRRIRDLFRIDLVFTFVVALAIGLSWYLAAYEVGGQKFLQWQLTMNLWSRFVPAEAGGAGYCVHPFWYFTPHTIAGFIPWSAYLPAVAIYAWPRRGRKLPEAAVFTLCWFTAIFVFFSTSHGKCLIYILPAFPPLGVLTGVAIDAAIPPRREPEISSAAESTVGAKRALETRDRAFAIAFSIASAAIAVVAIAIAVAAFAVVIFGMPSGLFTTIHPTDRRFLELFAALANGRSLALFLLIAACIASGVAGFIGLWRRDAQLQAAGVLILAAAGSLFWFGILNPGLAELETLRDFAREVTRTVPPGTEVAHLGLSDCDLNFYSPQPLPPIYRLRCDQGAASPNFVVARKIDFDATRIANRACYKPILESPPVDSNGPRLLLQRIP